MKWRTAASDRPDLAGAVREAAANLHRELGSAEPNLILLFLSEHHRDAYRDAATLVGSEFGSSMILGCSARSVIGGGQEIEDRPAVSLTAACLPGVTLRPFHFDRDSLPDPTAIAKTWRDRLAAASGDPHFLLLSDPFSFDVEQLVRGLDVAFLKGQKVGGVASGGKTPGDNALYLGGRVHRSGVVGVALSGDLHVDTIVAQGCRPIGAPMFVTRSRDNVLHELDGRPALDVLRDLFRELSPADQALCRTSLFLGLEMKQAQSEYQQGDFLIRNLLGSDADSGALIVGALLHGAQVVQFHLRDARTSAQDLETRLARYRSHTPPGAQGAVLFSCLGRGAHLYGRPNHDSDLLRRHLGDVPVGGFFCNGEIGPVQGTTFLHGYASAFGIFRPRGWLGGQG
ncbi:MAG: hypothetical protein FJ144_26290 [Deltaproteobacteria bacterium]|nr:hypothetical protein [Deltaproteobacteria bacterium]